MMGVMARRRWDLFDADAWHFRSTQTLGVYEATAAGGGVRAADHAG